MKKFLSSSSFTQKNTLLEAGLIAASLIIPFGIQIGRLGLYGDEWSLVLAPEYANNVSIFERTIQIFLIKVAGVQPTLYHLVTLLMLFIIGMILNKVLMQYGIDRLSAISGVLLFELYPGFLQPVSGLNLIGILIGLTFVILSLLYYLKWQRATSPGLKFLVIGIICSLISIAITPFTAALTSFTFLFLYLVHGNNQKKVESSVLGILLVLSGVLFVFRFSHENGFLNANLIIRTLRIWLESFVVCWRQVLSIPVNGRETLIYVLIMIFSAFILFWLFRTIEKDDNQNSENIDSRKSIFDLTIMICCAIAGFGYIFLLLVSGFNVAVQYPFDLALVSTGVFAAIFIVLGLKTIFLPKYRLAILVMLIVLAGGAKYSIVNRYADENSKVEDLLAQMSVRGDYFKSGTVLISEQLPFDYTTQKSIDGLLNYRFNTNKENGAVTYLSADNPELREFLHNPSANQTELRIDDKPLILDKNNLVGFWEKPGECMHILDEKSEISALPEELKYVASISRPELFEIANLSDVKQLNQFRNKISNGWCFYYQLANRQEATGNWQGVIDTYADADGQGFTPKSFSDYLPVLRATLNEKLFSQSMEVSKEFISQPEQKEIICLYWKKYQTDSNLTEEVESEVEKDQIVLGCP